MATNKHAVIRYEALNKCFSNRSRKFFIDDLINYVSIAIQEYTGEESSISRRQIFKDIDFMKSEAGFKAPIVAIKDGKKSYYRYEDKEYSMSANKLNPVEADLLKSALDILGRFKGIPNFDFVNELSLQLQKSFQIQNLEHVIFFEQNEHLRNIECLGDLLKAIQAKDVLQIVYKSYHRTEEETFVFHPYFLKQYNKRWFLFGQREEYNTWSNLALDRIISFNKEYKENYRPINGDPEEYFEDIMGVSKPSKSEAEHIQIRVVQSLWPYIDSKPLHPSQKVLTREEKAVIIQLELIPNYEFYSHILSFGSAIEVLEPLEIRETVKAKLEDSLKNYLIDFTLK